MVKKIRCICEICTCGRHHCVHRPKEPHVVKSRCLVTEYKDTYKQFSASPVRPIKPESTARISNEPFDGTTMYKMTFVPLKQEKVVRKQQQEYTRPEGTIDLLSSYQRDYEEKHAGRVKSARPEHTFVSSGRPFDGTTVHQETYKQWETPVIKSIQPPKATLRSSGSKFEHKTTFQNDFPGFYGTTSRKMIKPPSCGLLLGSDEFVSETTTKRDYTPKMVAPEKSAKPLSQAVTHTDGFDHKTTAQHAFAWPENVDPAISCKPTNQANLSKEAFQGDTTHNATFREWKVEPTPRRKARQNWEPAKSKFEFKTTFQDDFIGQQGTPAKSQRPQQQAHISQDAFQDATTNRMTYRPWTATHREIRRPDYAYERPKTRFQGCSTFQADFKGQQAKRPDLCVPQGNKLHVGEERNFSTSYNDSFVKGGLPLCPARYLHGRQSDTNDFMYSHDQRGHQFFKRFSQTNMDNVMLQAVEG